jgi:hypothetical protein
MLAIIISALAILVSVASIIVSRRTMRTDKAINHHLDTIEARIAAERFARLTGRTSIYWRIDGDTIVLRDRLTHDDHEDDWRTAYANRAHVPDGWRPRLEVKHTTPFPTAPADRPDSGWGQ